MHQPSMRRLLSKSALVCLLTCPIVAGAQTPVDVNGDSATDAVDLQLVINQVLGLETPIIADLNCDESENAVDVQITILAILGQTVEVCDTGANLFPGQLPLGQELDLARISGYLYQDSGFVFVAEPASAPQGSAPAVGVVVEARDIEGELVADALTDSTGFFELTDVPSGLVNLATAAKGGIAEEPLPVTAYPGAEIAVAESYPINRDTAVSTVMSMAPAGALVLGAMQPLEAGTRVWPLGVEDPENHVLGYTLPAPAWFFYIDEMPNMRFGHQVSFVFVNAATGDVNTAGPGYGPPRVNYGALWDDDRDWTVYDGVDFDALQPSDDLPESITAEASPEVVYDPLADSGKAWFIESSDPLAESLKNHNAAPEGMFLLIVNGHEGSDGVNDMLRMYKFFVNANVPLPNIRVVQTHKLHIKFAVEAYNAALAALNTKIQDRLDQGLHSTLFFYYTGHGVIRETGENTGEYIPVGATIPNIMPDRWISWSAGFYNLKSTPACELRCILDTCYAKLFGIEIANNINTLPQSERPDLIVYASADNDEPSGYYSVLGAALTFNTPGGVYTTEFLNNAFIAGGEIGGVLNASGVPTFTLPDQTPQSLVEPNVPARCQHSETTVCDIRGEFSNGTADCPLVPGFTDYFYITIIDGEEMRIQQPSTGDVNTGSIQPDGMFEVASESGNESYIGSFDPETCSGTATNYYTNSEGCTLTYDVIFYPREE